ncbi:hypothetical protein [Halopseudomonas aestusnigri]|jgi:hypothetical protein|uniref:AbiTii domain-containing protein n=1 Tax=Halopseudomonas aestusnigri TaxID=857252 RepID=UPI0028C0FBBC|nr:hypothetical protein YSKK_03860 [Halopseudomonas aestusnigri]
MDLINPIIEILSSENPNLTDALIKTKVLLYKLGEKHLIEWVNHELDGYGGVKDLPDYRVVGSRVKANIMNAAYSANEVDVPVYHLEHDIRDSLERSEFRQGIAAIEDLANSEGDSVQRPISHALYGLLSEKFASGYKVQSAWCEIPKYSLIQIITQVRSRLLDFLLELSEKIPNTDEEGTDLKKVSKEIGTESLFNNAVFGNNTTIIVGDNNAQTVDNSITTNDLNSLKKFLSSYQVSNEDLEELEVAVTEDAGSEAIAKQELGPKVKAWVKGMIGKAVDGTWTVGTGAAGNILASALNSFYGWF